MYRYENQFLAFCLKQASSSVITVLLVYPFVCLYQSIGLPAASSSKARFYLFCYIRTLTRTTAQPAFPVPKTLCLTGPRWRLATGGTEGGVFLCARTPGCTPSPGQPTPHPELRPEQWEGLARVLGLRGVRLLMDFCPCLCHPNHLFACFLNPLKKFRLLTCILLTIICFTIYPGFYCLPPLAEAVRQRALQLLLLLLGG